MPKHPNDARLWALLADVFYDAGATAPEDRGRFARRAVALVRRERATTAARTYAPGDEIPYDVTRAYDLDGAEWTRQGQPPDSLKDTWKMTGFNPGRARVGSRRGLGHARVARRVRAAHRDPAAQAEGRPLKPG
jgi:hypothetical protein